MKIYSKTEEGDLVLWYRLQCTFSSYNSDNKSRQDFYSDRSHKLEQVSDLCRWVCLKAHTHTHTFAHTRTHTDPSSSHWSKLVNQISVVPTCLDLYQDTRCRLLWMNSGTHSLPPLPLYRSAVCRCAAVCNRFFSAALQPEASTGLSGRKSITAGLSLACGGAYGRKIRT